MTERTFVETTQAVGTIRPHTVLQVVGYLNRDVVVNLHSTVTPSRYAHLQLVMIPSASCATTTQSLPDGACIPPSQFSDLFLKGKRSLSPTESSDATASPSIQTYSLFQALTRRFSEGRRYRLVAVGEWGDA